MTVRIASSLLAQIVAHAAATPRMEVCGLLFGKDGRISAATPVHNVAATPADSFEIDPGALFAAMRAARAGGPALLGHYHSHPNGRAEPSRRDATAAHDAGRLWLIVADGRAACFAAERGGPLLGAFRPVAMAVEG